MSIKSSIFFLYLFTLFIIAIRCKENLNLNNDEWVSEWLLFNNNSAIFQLYHGENDDEIRFVLDQHDLPH
jgi:hypothetical protein